MIWIVVIFGLVIGGLWIVLQIVEAKGGGDGGDADAGGGGGIPFGEWYEARGALLSEAELRFYRVLREVLRHPTDPRGADQALVMCKVRMVDLVGIKKGLERSKHQSAFNRIKSKHVDFVLVRPGDMGVLCVIELDDSSHNTKKGKARDSLVDSVYEAAGIGVVHVACKGSYVKEEVAGVIRGVVRG